MEKEKLSPSLAKNLQKLQSIFAGDADINIHHFFLGRKNMLRAVLLYDDGLVEKESVNRDILQPLLAFEGKRDVFDLLTYLERHVIHLIGVERLQSCAEIAERAFSGYTILLVEGQAAALSYNTKHYAQRSIEEPATEVVVRGPRECFIENIDTNISLLRRKVKNPALRFEAMRLGELSRTQVCIAYIEGVADEKILSELRKRLSGIKMDMILESGYLEQMMEDAPNSMFATVGNSEKPDQVAGKIAEGRVAILTDGTPFVLTVPMLFAEAFQSSEDYYSRPIYVSFLRIVRFLAFFLSILLPAVYIGVANYQQELIPRSLLVSMASADASTPFSASASLLIMDLMYEMLREASVRLPRAAGQAMSIVGALIMGEAAVSAGLVSASVVIIIAISAIASYVVVPLIDAGGVLRILFIVLASFLGFFGLVLAALLLLVHLARLRSFGAPYLSPFAPASANGMKDALIRAPLWALRKRPEAIVWKKESQVSTGEKPHPPGRGGKRL